MDPPYFSNKSSKLYGESGDLHTNFDHIRLFKYISTKRNWVMTYDNCKFIKDLYKDFKQIEVSWAYGMTHSKQELLILGKKMQEPTNQLKNELKHKEQFLKNLKRFGLKIGKEYSPTDNKKYLTSADYLCAITTTDNPVGKKARLSRLV